MYCTSVVYYFVRILGIDKIDLDIPLACLVDVQVHCNSDIFHHISYLLLLLIP